MAKYFQEDLIREISDNATNRNSVFDQGLSSDAHIEIDQLTAQGEFWVSISSTHLLTIVCKFRANNMVTDLCSHQRQICALCRERGRLWRQAAPGAPRAKANVTVATAL